MGTKWVQSSLSAATTESLDNERKPQLSHCAQDSRSAVQPPVRDLIDGQRVRLGRLMANPERDHSEPDRAGWLTGIITAPKRPAGHGTFVLTQPPSRVPSRPSASQTSSRSRGRPPSRFELAPQRLERFHTALAQPREVLSHGELIEGNREDRPSALIGWTQPSPSRARFPKWSSNSSALNRCSPWRVRIDSTDVSLSTSSTMMMRARSTWASLRASTLRCKSSRVATERTLAAAEDSTTHRHDSHWSWFRTVYSCK
jgi:hypothetical protein